MAGDWIPIETTLPDKPEVARVAKALGKSRDEIVGMLVRFWVWAQAHTADGHLPGMTADMLADVVHVPYRLFGELQKVGWLSETEGGLSIPNFERWLSQGAKRRLKERDKKRRQRSDTVVSLSRSCPDFVPKLSRCDRDKNGTTEEKRIEKSINNPLPHINSPSPLSPNGDSSPDGDAARSDPDRIAFDEWWSFYPRKVGKQAAFRAYVNARKRICKERACTPAEAWQLLSDACVAFAGSRKAKSEFCPHPTTWLNQGRYEDDPSEWDRVESVGKEPSLDEVLEQALRGTD